MHPNTRQSVRTSKRLHLAEQGDVVAAQRVLALETELTSLNSPLTAGTPRMLNNNLLVEFSKIWRFFIGFGALKHNNHPFDDYPDFTQIFPVFTGKSGLKVGLACPSLGCDEIGQAKS
jgi:hypothetical protein